MTWQHAKSKQWSYIDYVTMRECDRRMCSDVTVKRGAECNTDHQFLCASVIMAWRGLKKRAGMNEGKRYGVLGLVSCKASDNMSTGRPLQQEYIEEVLERATSAWPEEGTVEERWEVMRSSLLESADELLGYEKSRLPDWFLESADGLRPQLQRRNNAYEASGKQEDLTRFKFARNEAKKSIREAKNSWFRANAQEAEGERFGGKKVWKCIRDMQFGRRGRVTTRVVAICDESGEPCSTPTEHHQR